MHAKRIESWMDELCILSKFTIPATTSKRSIKSKYGLIQIQGYISLNHFHCLIHSDVDTPQNT